MLADVETGRIVQTCAVRVRADGEVWDGAMIPIGKPAEIEAFKLTNSLRREGFHIEMGYRGKTKNRMKNANSINASAAIIIGDEEILKSVVTIRDLDTGEQTQLSMDQLSVYLERFL